MVETANSQVKVLLWGGSSTLHVDSSCPAAPSDGRWYESFETALLEACDLCRTRTPALQFVGPTPLVAAARLGIYADALTTSVAAAVTGSGADLCDAGLHLVLAATSAQDLGSGTQFQGARRTASNLRLRYREDFYFNIALRAAAGSPLAGSIPEFTSVTREARKAVRWALRHGYEVERLCEVLRVEVIMANQVVRYLQNMAEEAASSAPHLLLGTATELPSGTIPELLSEAGVLGDLHGHTGAVVLPQGVVKLLNSPFSGITLADAGEVDPGEVSSDLLDLTSQLWHPRSGVLSDAPAALAVARGLVT